ncbi:MAG: NAD-dependent epimerase/dehydratase family protein [Myxococcales bacterium]|nr:NAD-dependent epimerase/dehydratase family protein [Myxococcales bacterium]
MRPTLAITGATGFVGKRLCEMALAAGYSVRALGRNFSGFHLDSARCTRWPVALSDRAGLGLAFNDVDAVIHVAALSSPWGLRRDFFEVNVVGTRHVITAATQARVRRVVHCSSASVAFGDRDGFDLDESSPLPRRYLAAYCESKALAEAVVRAAGGVEWCIVRPRGVFGPGDTSILPRLVARARSGRLRVIGDGQNIQDITYVDNCAAALLRAAEAEAAHGQCYFISNGAPVALWPFLTECLRGVGAPLPRGRVPYAVALRAAALYEALAERVTALGEPPLTPYTVSILARSQTVNISKAQAQLGYRPEVNLGDGLARTIDWFNQQGKVVT